MKLEMFLPVMKVEYIDIVADILILDILISDAIVTIIPIRMVESKPYKYASDILNDSKCSITP